MTSAEIALLVPNVYTAPVIEPVTLAEVRDQLRIVGTDEDPHLALYITAARKWFESRTGRTCITTTYDLVLDDWPEDGDVITLPRATPLSSVTSITYKDSTGTVNTWSSSLYIVDTDHIPGRVAPAYGEAYPSFTPYPLSPIKIRYVAGSASVGDEQKLPIMMLVAGLYENRESDLIAVNVQRVAVQYGVEAYIRLNQIAWAA